MYSHRQLNICISYLSYCYYRRTLVQGVMVTSKGKNPILTVDLCSDD